jgi:glycosyltransferase involved in cell wall biosynthesis
MEPLVSICIPVYNGARYLGECLDSVLAQDLDDYEVVVVDDGSTDESHSIIESYQKRCSGIRFFRNEKNLGLVGNWNRCLEMAKGKWIKMVFQDDLIAPSCLRKMMQAAEDSQALVVCQRHFLIEKDAPEYLSRYFQEEVLTLEKIFDGNVPGFIPARTASTLALRYLTLNFIGEPSSILFKRAMIDRFGYFDPELAQVCDLEYCLRIASQYGIKYVHDPLCTFRVHGESTTSVNTSGKHFVSLYADPVHLSLKLLRNPSFSRLRHAASYFLRLKLEAYCRLKMYESYLFLKNDPEVGMGRQGQILQNLPEFIKWKHPGLFIRILYRIALLRRKKTK